MSKFVVDEYVLMLTFNRLERNGEIYYWRECIIRDGMEPDEVGYIVLYPDGEHLHTYHHPESFL